MRYVQTKGHRALIGTLLILVLIAITGCSTVKTDVYTIEGEPIANIKIDIKESTISNEGISADIVNNMNEILAVSGDCYLEKKSGNWVSIPDINGDSVILSIASCDVKQNSTETININWANVYGAIESGEYRLVLVCNIDGQEYKLVKPFRIE